MKDQGTKEIAILDVTAHGRRRGVGTQAPSIIIHDGDEIGALHGVTADVTVIGRGPESDIVLAEDQVSRRHAMLRRLPGEPPTFELVDLDSTNGTYVNGTLATRAKLGDGDKIVIGKSTLKFTYLDQQDISYQAKIVDMIHVDELTGLLTKRSFYRALQKEIPRAQRYGRAFAVLMMDLDHFKAVNDTHGHLAGSACLAEVGRHVRESTRQVDVNGRYGGEEFVSFLPETGGEEALLVADRLREGLAGRVMRSAGASFQVTISIGVATFPIHGTSVEELVHAADLALYEAKNAGRNRCVLHDAAALVT